MLNIKIGNHTLYNGDCLEIMKQIPDNSIDLVLTDPPYLYTIGKGGHSDLTKKEQKPQNMARELGYVEGGHSGLSKRAKKLQKNISFISNGFDYNTVFKEFKRVCKPLNLYIFCSNLQITKIMSYFEKEYATTLLCWYKTNAIPLASNSYHNNLEFIVCVREKGAYFNNSLTIGEKSKIYLMPYPTKNRCHPTQKPLELIQKLLNVKSKQNDTVLDCFMGSGTTGVACEKLKRKFIGIEIDEKYYKIAQDRIKKEYNQIKLF